MNAACSPWEILWSEKKLVFGFLGSSLVSALLTPAWILAARNLNLKDITLDIKSVWIGILMILGFCAKGYQKRGYLTLEALLKIRSGARIMDLPLMTGIHDSQEPHRNRALQLFPDLPFRICALSGNLLTSACSLIFLLIISLLEVWKILPLLILMILWEYWLNRRMVLREFELQLKHQEKIFYCSRGKIEIARQGTQFPDWMNVLRAEESLIRDRLTLDLWKNRTYAKSRALLYLSAGCLLMVLLMQDNQPDRLALLGVILWRSMQAFNQMAPALYQLTRIRHLQLEWIQACRPENKINE